VLGAVAAEWLRDVVMLQAERRRRQKESQQADKCHESVQRFSHLVMGWTMLATQKIHLPGDYFAGVILSGVGSENGGRRWLQSRRTPNI